MDIIVELVRYIIIIIIGIVLIKWYERKKGWEHQFKTTLFFILCWRTLMFFIIIIMNFILDLVFLGPEEIYSVTPLILVPVSFFFNIFLGVNLFKFTYKKTTQESIVIILIIVIIEMILEGIILYSILIPETLIANFNL